MKAITDKPATLLATTLATCALAAAVLAAGAQAAAAPVKLIPGARVGLAFEGNVAVQDDPSSPLYGDVYISDPVHHRVQLLSAAGALILMFGWEVNATKQAEGAPQPERDLCVPSKETCQAGTSGPLAGQLGDPASLAVDPASGDVYVAEYIEAEHGSAYRVQKLTADGGFLLELGREVNSTTKANLCSAEEVAKAGVRCAGPQHAEPAGNEHGSFNLETAGGVLAVGGPEDLLYVGEEHRVQEFKPSGEWTGEIPLTALSEEPYSEVQTLALDRQSGNVYVVYPYGELVHELTPAGQELASFPVLNPTATGAQVYLEHLAADAAGHLAASAFSEGQVFGALYDASDGTRLSSIAIPTSSLIEDLSFNGEGDLFAVSAGEAGPQLGAYTPAPAPSVRLTGSPSCPELLGAEASVLFACSLAGEVDPEGVAETEALFQTGRALTLGEATAPQAVAAPGAVRGVVDARPNSTLYYRLAAYNDEVKAPEQVETEVASVPLPAVAPRVLDALSAPVVGPTSAGLAGKINPENTDTTYRFLLARACATGEACAPLSAATTGVLSSESQQSVLYGAAPVNLEISGLQPATTYRYALTAVNEHGEAALDETGAGTLPEATFTTAAAPAPQAATGATGAIGTSTATISGSVNPDDVPVTYTFEIGVYEGANTQYGVIASASIAPGSAPVQETLDLTGLQPGQTYAYRIAVHSGYIQNPEHTTYGATASFTTAGLASSLALPIATALLPAPPITFPAKTTATPTPKALTKTQELAKALSACHKDNVKTRRKTCERAARRKLGAAKPKPKRK